MHGNREVHAHDHHDHDHHDDHDFEAKTEFFNKKLYEFVE